MHLHVCSVDRDEFEYVKSHSRYGVDHMCMWFGMKQALGDFLGSSP